MTLQGSRAVVLLNWVAEAGFPFGAARPPRTAEGDQQREEERGEEAATGEGTPGRETYFYRFGN